jgi:NADH dehydrogenase/NADH:ubiquinone oxidoreductase subunit G
VRTHVAIGAFASGLTDAATVVLPAATHYESEGVYVAMNGRAQRLRPAAALPTGAAPGWELLVALAHRLGAPPPYRTAASAFAAAAAARPALAGLDYDALGDLGHPIQPASVTSGMDAAGRPGRPEVDPPGGVPTPAYEGPRHSAATLAAAPLRGRSAARARALRRSAWQTDRATR